ncbi:hypothetical protein JQK87_12945 [Streptomyces sp. G44]|uniref:hypothetical protein n=1 Tax=Streptomyces sp. G44 TaxID=2807632 RepID=UPI001960213A|nr:hypothetical protein [Streptomyces sp. G44]MBM7169308.1 hypothetical protein [Streptomyces sp. G44]
MTQQRTAPEQEPAGRQRTPRRLRSSTVVLGSMGVLAAALTSCGSEPDRRCVDRDSYEGFLGYKIVSDKHCKTTAGSSTGKGRKAGGKGPGSYGTGSHGTGRTPGRTDPAWYYDAEVDGRYADDGTFSRSEAVDRDGFGCSGDGSGGSGSSGG